MDTGDLLPTPVTDYIFVVCRFCYQRFVYRFISDTRNGLAILTDPISNPDMGTQMF